MAALLVRSRCEDSRDNVFLEQKTQQQKIGLDDETCYLLVARLGRCESSCMERYQAFENMTPLDEVRLQTCL